MNDFWEWRSSMREFNGRPTRGGKFGLIVGTVLFAVLAVVFVIFEYAQ